MAGKTRIDAYFDFTTDTPHFWDRFWENNDGLGAGGADPDAASPTLQEYHRILWSRPLPNGEVMELTRGDRYTYLTWNGFRFGSDSITASFRYRKYRPMIEDAAEAMPDYRAYMEAFLRKCYTIGGAIIFPKRANSINQARGRHWLIRDRWDLTLECIRRFYSGADSPLSDVLEEDRAFFELFVDFRGYTDFFFLQDCLSENRDKVEIWLGKGDFSETPLPKNVEEYLQWLKIQMEFVNRRNARIQDYADKMSPNS